MKLELKENILTITETNITTIDLDELLNRDIKDISYHHAWSDRGDATNPTTHSHIISFGKDSVSLIRISRSDSKSIRYEVERKWGSRNITIKDSRIKNKIEKIILFKQKIKYLEDKFNKD